MKKRDRDEFALFCKQATDQQIVNIYWKERDANRKDYARIAAQEMTRRGLTY